MYVDVGDGEVEVQHRLDSEGVLVGDGDLPLVVGRAVDVGLAVEEVVEIDYGVSLCCLDAYGHPVDVGRWGCGSAYELPVGAFLLAVEELFLSVPVGGFDVVPHAVGERLLARGVVDGNMVGAA